MKTNFTFNKRYFAGLLSMSMLLFMNGTPVAAQVAATCTPTYTYGCTSGDDIDDVTLVGASATLTNMNTPCPANAYQDYTTSTSLSIPDLLPGQSYSGTVTTNYTGTYEYVKIWIDFDDNGVFASTEEVAAFGPIDNTSTGAYTMAIPLTATPGMKRMRVVVNYSSSPSGPCGSFSWGETHDYKVQILSLTPCTNPPVAGTATISPAGQSCPGSPVTLSLTGIVMGSGQTYEWESSPNNVTYTSTGAASLSPNLTVSPLVTTWYRCKVVCSGGTPAYSTPVQISVAAGLSGTYTVNSANPTAGTNFNNFADLAAALNCGIVAPVTVNVVAGSGPYNGTFNLNAIGGASATNRVRINGNGETIQFNSTSTSNHRIVSLDGSKYVTISNLKIKTLNATYGWGIHIGNNAEKDSIINCQIDMSSITGTSSVNASGIVLSGSSTSTTTATTAKTIYIGNNTIIAGSTGSGGGYYGITSTGSSSALNDSISIVGNEITNFYYYGIRITYANAPNVSNNNVHRSTQTAIGTSAYGIYYYYCIGGKAVGNRVHDMAATGATSSSSFYGIYVYNYNNTAATPVLVANNAVYNLKNYYGIQYLMYIYGPAHKVYHNTIDASTVQSASTSTMYGMYIGYNTGTEVKNNIINITGGNTGTKYGIYHSSTSYAANYQKNNVYINTTQSGTQTPYYYGSAYASLAAFQAAYPTQELGSPAVAPVFTNPAAGDLTPSTGALIGTGANVFSDVPTDIVNLPRSTAPTIGAFEIAPVGNNNARMFAILNPTGNVCTGAQPVSVVVGNAGVNNITSMQVNWSLNGVTQTPLSYTTPTYPTLVPMTSPTGQFSDTVTLGNANLIAGANTIRVWTTLPNGQPDSQPGNDTAQLIITPATFALTTANDTVCYGATFALNLSPASPYANNSLQWESSTNGGTTWNTAATNNNNIYTVNNLTANTSYRVKILTGGSSCYSPVKAISIFNISLPTTTSASRCGPGTVTLNATPGAGGGTLKWYEDLTTFTDIATGNTFTTPNLTATTTYYVATSAGGGNQVAGMPVPQSTSGNSGFSDVGLMFNATSAFTLGSVDVYPTGTAGTGSITIALKNSTGTTLQTTTAPVTVSSTGTLNTVPLNFTVTPGTNYRLVVTAASGMSTLIRESGTIPYPYTLPGVLSITSSYTGGASPSYYYYFYNWKIASGCESARVPVTATINEVPDPNLGTDLDTCTFNAIPMTLDPGTQPAGATYAWDNNTTGAQRNINTSGTYHVTVTTPQGCIKSDTIVILMREKPAIDLDAGGTSFCNGATKILDAGPGGQNGGTYYWSTGAQTQTIEVTSAGTYIAFVTSPDGCANADTITVIEAGYAPTIDGIQALAMNSNTFSFTAINPQYVTTYEWNFGDGSPVSTSPNPSKQYNQSGHYLVTLKSNSTCADRLDSAYVNIIGVGINDKDENLNTLTIYPNPNVLGILNIDAGKEVTVHKISMINVVGQTVAEINNITTHQNVKQIILPKHLASGIYNLKIETDKGITTRKIEIRK
ncbi:MAG: T9SS type A sorting domain-containing protein [Sphingobacteriales bacterium]|nr:MAG: T9SS type A sorting domain-containing protein [Sphingobacteriales bacterium]